MTRMVYVRHGESNTTVARVIGGPRTCSGLSPLGIAQAERLRDRWVANREFVPDVIVTSLFPRARQTAEIVAGAFAGVPIVEDGDFGEHDPGPDCDGMAMADFVERYGTEAWDQDPFGVSFPGGETLAEFHFRVGVAVRRMVDLHPGGTVLVFCHGGVIDAVLRHALRTTPTGGFAVNTLNTSITELVRNRHGWVMHRYGDSAHLAGLPATSRVG